MENELLKEVRKLREAIEALSTKVTSICTVVG